MANKLKILHLEDARTDAELIERELNKGHILFEKLVVDRRTDFIKALKEFSPDIILSDHTLPSFNSIEALKIVKQLGNKIPFILVTATVSEEFAVNIMKEGAYDYILKDRLQRLPRAVLNAMEKRNAELELQSAYEKLVFHLENTPLGFIEWDNEGYVKSRSKRAEEIFGWSEAEDTDSLKNGFSHVYEEDRPLVIKMAEEILSGNVERNHVQNRNYTKDGRVIWCEWFNSVLKDKNGKVITIMSLVHDITERKLAEEKLKRSEFRLNKAEEIAHLGNWEVDLLNGAMYWSDEFFEIFGIKKEHSIPSIELFLSSIHPEDLAFASSKVENAFLSLTNSSFNFRFIKRSGEVRDGYDEWQFEFDENKKPVRLYGIIKDITEQKKSEEERTKMIADILQRNKNLEQFSYIVSHNLRAPVANILGLSSMLQKDDLQDTLKKKIMLGIFSSANKLDEVIKDLNNILKVKQEVNENKQVVNFSVIVNDIQSSIGSTVEREKAVIITDFSQVDEMLTIKSYLYSIFYNLISNSLKYRQSHISPVIEIKSQKLNDKIVLFFKDNGLGIDLQKQGEQVFGLYKRFHTNLAEGRGMGLFMVKTQVETIGGEISVHSEVNKGTEFKIEFEAPIIQP